MGHKSRPRNNESTLAPERLGTLRGICLAQPNAIEKVAWGDPTWRVEGRIFAMQKGNYPGGRPSVWFKAEDGAQGMLVESAPHLYFVPPYVGHKGWVGAYLDNDSVNWGELDALLEFSYARISGRKRK